MQAACVPGRCPRAATHIPGLQHLPGLHVESGGTASQTWTVPAGSSSAADTSRLTRGPVLSGAQPGSRTHANSQRGRSAQKREYKAQGEEERKNSRCYTPLSCNSVKIFQMRGSGRACESLSKPILPDSPSSPLSRPHTHPFFEAAGIIKPATSFSKSKNKPFPLLRIVQLQLLSHQHGPAQRMARAGRLGHCSFPAHPTPPLGPMMGKSLHTPCSSLHSVLSWILPGEHYYTQPYWSRTAHNLSRAAVRGKQDLLGTRLMAFRGLRTRTVRIADKLMFWRSREYSTILQEGREKDKKKSKFKRIQNFGFSHSHYFFIEGFLEVTGVKPESSGAKLKPPGAGPEPTAGAAITLTCCGRREGKELREDPPTSSTHPWQGHARGMDVSHEDRRSGGCVAAFAERYLQCNGALPIFPSSHSAGWGPWKQLQVNCFTSCRSKLYLKW